MQLCGTPTIFYCWPGLVIFSIRPARGIPSKPIDASADASRSPRTRPHIGSFAGHPGGRRYCGPPTGAFPLGTVLPRRRPSRHGASRASDSRIRVTRTPRCVLGSLRLGLTADPSIVRSNHRLVRTRSEQSFEIFLSPGLVITYCISLLFECPCGRQSP